MEVAIELEISGQRVEPWKMHREARDIYLWGDVVQRTEQIYHQVHRHQASSALTHRIPRLYYHNTCLIPSQKNMVNLVLDKIMNINAWVIMLMMFQVQKVWCSCRVVHDVPRHFAVPPSQSLRCIVACQG